MQYRCDYKETFGQRNDRDRLSSQLHQQRSQQARQFSMTHQSNHYRYNYAASRCDARIISNAAALPLTRYRQVDRTTHHKRQSHISSNDNNCQNAGARPSRRGAGREFDSLCPHGDPVLDEWSSDDYGMYGRWTYRENPTWRPPVESRTGDYSGTELIKARGGDVLTSSHNGTSTLYENIRSLPWQMISVNAKKRASDCYENRSYGSDSSSMKSGSSLGESSPSEM